MTRFTLNVRSGPARRITKDGREYFVTTATSIVPGVLNGSKGALAYFPDEIAANVADWDDVPVTLFHPIAPEGHVSASHPGVLGRQGIGFIRDSNYRGRLRHTVWLDVQNVRAADRRFGTDLHGMMVRGDPVELSTGLFTDNEACLGPHCHVNGRPYEYVARNYRPDHLAILPHGQRGACSLEDGCGLNINANPEGHNQYTGTAEKAEYHKQQADKHVKALQGLNPGGYANALHHAAKNLHREASIKHEDAKTRLQKSKALKLSDEADEASNKAWGVVQNVDNPDCPT